MAYYVDTPSSIVSRVVNFILGIIQTGLGLRLILEFFGANPSALFVAWIYSITEPLMRPFLGIFPSWNLAGFILDFSTITALVAYALLGWLVLALFSFLLSTITPYEYEPRVQDV